MIVQLLTLLSKLKDEYDADGVKVYFANDDSYCIKVIKDKHVIHVIRKGGHRNNFD